MVVREILVQIPPAFAGVAAVVMLLKVEVRKTKRAPAIATACVERNFTGAPLM